MQIRNTAERYGAVSQTLHWLTVLCVGLAWVLGVVGEELAHGAVRNAGLFIHINAGLAIIVLLVLRLLWRTVDPPPPAEPTVFGYWADRAARFVHYVLYALLILVPVTGIMVQFARGNALPVFGLLEIASPRAPDRAFARSVKEVHELFAHALIILALLHAAAALFHHWVMHDRTLARMLPR